MVIKETELYKQTILAAFSNHSLVCEFDDIVAVGEICYFDGLTCKMNAHFHFFIHVPGSNGWVQSSTFYDLIDLAVLIVFLVSKAIAISSFIFMFLIH